MKRFFLFLILFCFISAIQLPIVHAQEADLFNTPPPTTPTASASAKATAKKTGKSVTEPEAEPQKRAVLNLLNKRASGEMTYSNILPYAMKYTVLAGVPANTIILILLIPLLATIIVSFRYIVGLSGLGLLVPIALSITLLATGVTPGFILLAAILLSSFLSRFLLKRIRIMQMPKMALSMLVVAVFLTATLALIAVYGIFDVSNVSIFPILLLLLLSDRVTALFMERDMEETIITTAITLLLGFLGFVLLSWDTLRSFILLYPETILLLIPLNIVIGRYFGLRVTEYIKFQPVLKHGSK